MKIVALGTSNREYIAHPVLIYVTWEMLALSSRVTYACRGELAAQRHAKPAMHRLTARLLLVLLLVGTFAPVALAISAPVPHACCMRKPLHDQGSRRVEGRARLKGRLQHPLPSDLLAAAVASGWVQQLRERSPSRPRPSCQLKKHPTIAPDFGLDLVPHLGKPAHARKELVRSGTGAFFRSLCFALARMRIMRRFPAGGRKCSA